MQHCSTVRSRLFVIYYNVQTMYVLCGQYTQCGDVPLEREAINSEVEKSNCKDKLDVQCSTFNNGHQLHF